jgi:hypothetical protein
LKTPKESQKTIENKNTGLKLPKIGHTQSYVCAAEENHGWGIIKMITGLSYQKTVSTILASPNINNHGQSQRCGTRRQDH